MMKTKSRRILAIVMALLLAASLAPAAQAEQAEQVKTLDQYLADANVLAKTLGAGRADKTLMSGFNELYKNNDFQGAYDYYLENEETMKKSCWMMNNVGLAMLQLEMNEEALTLFMAIMIKMQDEQPESVLNLQVAAYQAGIDTGEAIRAVGMTATKIQDGLYGKNYESNIVDSLVHSMAYNELYVQLDEEGTILKTNGTETADPVFRSLMAGKTSASDMLKMLRDMAGKDSDAKALYTYLEALYQQRKADKDAAP